MKPLHILFTSLILCALVLLIPVRVFSNETVVFWYGATQDEKSAYDKMISDFEKANPDITVKPMLVPMKYIERMLMLSIAGEVPPDVVRFYAHLGGELMSRGGLEPLDSLISRDKFDTRDFYPVGLAQNTYKGKLYGIPWIMSPNALFYNRTLFREAGLDTKRPPRNWDELRSYAKKLTKLDSNGIPSQVGFADFLYSPNNFMMYSWQLGGDMLKPNTFEADFSSPQCVKALDWMKSFVDDEVGGVPNLQVFSANFKGAAQDPFGQGKLAMRIDSPFRIPDLKKYFPNLDYGVASVPYSKTPAVEVIGNSLVIPKGSRHKEAAWRFIKFATSYSQVSAICKVAGRIPARRSAARSPLFYSDSKTRVFVDIAETGRSIPIVSGWQEASQALATQIEGALKGNISSQEALSNAAKTTNLVLKRANEDVSGFPIIDWLKIGVWAFSFLAIAGVAIFLYVRFHTRDSRAKRAEAVAFYSFASPWIIGFVVLTFGALLASVVISLSKWDAISPARYIGMRNYVEMFQNDALFYKAVSVTLYYAVFSIPLAIIGGLGISILLNQKLFGIRFFRTVYYLPAIISGVATSMVWLYLFNPTTGLINKLLSLSIIPKISAGGMHWMPLIDKPIAWLQDPLYAMPAFILMSIWGVGGAMVVYLAALQGIPEELYEAAKIDGAGPWKSFVNVTLPLISPAIFYQLVVGTMYSVQMFTQAYMMTDGGPENSTLFYALYLFKSSFEFMKLGYGSAMAWVLCLAVMVITMLHFWNSSRWVYYEGTKTK